MEQVEEKQIGHDKQFQLVEEHHDAMSRDLGKSTNTVDSVARNLYAALGLKSESEGRRL